MAQPDDSLFVGPGPKKARPASSRALLLARGILQSLQQFDTQGLENWQADELADLSLQTSKLIDTLERKHHS